MSRRLNAPRNIKLRRKRAQSGYILLLLLLTVAILAIMMTAAATRMAHQVKRDRETEMIHRGEQYARAVKKFVRKNGGYPASIEQLEKTNNIRYLRKRYKDPMTPDGKWKLMPLSQVQLGLAGANTGPNPLGGPAAKQEDQKADQRDQNSTREQGGTRQSGGGSLFSSPLSGQTFGGGPIAGVVSMSEQTGIREFNNKKRYNQWLFVYVQAQDAQCQSTSGCIIKGPFNPQAGTIGGKPVGTPVDQLNKSSTTQDPPPQNEIGPK